MNNTITENLKNTLWWIDSRITGWIMDMWAGRQNSENCCCRMNKEKIMKKMRTISETPGTTLNTPTVKL